MKSFTRGQFLGAAAGAAGVGLLSGCEGGPEVVSRTGSASATAPDLIVHGRVIHTMDDDNPTAESLAVKDGRFVAVGTRSDIEALRGAGTQVFDHGDAVVTPGFIDAHTHPAGAGVRELKDVNVDVRSIAEIKERIGARARETPPGEWIRGFKYDDTKLAEGRPLNRLDLDEVLPDHPAVVGHRGGHTSVYNSLAFAPAGVTAETPDPPGGKFYREDGELTGLVAERANYVFSGLIPSTHTDEDRQAGVTLITELMAKAGLTSFHDAGTSSNSLRAYPAAYSAGELSTRVYMMLCGPYNSLREAGVSTGFGDEWLRVGGVKYGADGSASERTMRMSTPYVGRPDDYGILTMSQEEIHEVAGTASSTAHWSIPSCSRASRRSAPSPLPSIPTPTTTATSGSSTAPRRWSGCSRTGRSWTTAFRWPRRPTTPPAPTSLSWPSRAWSRARTSTAAFGARASGSPRPKRCGSAPWVGPMHRLRRTSRGR